MTSRELLAQVELGNARRHFKKAELDSRRDKKPLPKRIYQFHMDEIRQAQRNVESATVTAGAMNEYPPIR